MICRYCGAREDLLEWTRVSAGPVIVCARCLSDRKHPQRIDVFRLDKGNWRPVMVWEAR